MNNLVPFTEHDNIDIIGGDIKNYCLAHTKLVKYMIINCSLYAFDRDFVNRWGQDKCKGV